MGFLSNSFKTHLRNMALCIHMHLNNWKTWYLLSMFPFGGIKLNQVLRYLKSYIHHVRHQSDCSGLYSWLYSQSTHTHTLTPCIFNKQDTHDNLYSLNKRWRWVCVSLSECRSECDSCFNKNFCTRCRAGFYLHLGKCQENCPEGLVRSDTQRECVSSECLEFMFIRDGDKTYGLPCIYPTSAMQSLPNNSDFSMKHP